MKSHATPYVATLVTGLMSLTLMACASHRSKEATAPNPATAAAAEQNNKTEPSSAALGDKIIKRESQAVYCKRYATTGSYILRTTRCRTAGEWEQAHDNDQRTLDEMRKSGATYPRPE